MLGVVVGILIICALLFMGGGSDDKNAQDTSGTKMETAVSQDMQQEDETVQLPEQSSSEGQMDVDSGGMGADKLISEITAFVESWREAWELSAGEYGSVDGYADHYSPEFQKGRFGKKQWISSKGKKNKRKQWIRVVISDLSVESLNSDKVEVRFTQNYQSSNYLEESAKTLLLQKEGDSWKILSER